MEIIEIIDLTPNHDIECSVCGNKPTVSYKLNGKFKNTGLCGSCYYGEAECFFPENWQEEIKNENK